MVKVQVAVRTTTTSGVLGHALRGRMLTRILIAALKSDVTSRRGNRCRSLCREFEEKVAQYWILAFATLQLLTFGYYNPLWRSVLDAIILVMDEG